MTSVDLEFDQLNSTVDALRRSISNRLMYGVGKDAVTAQPRDWLHAAELAVRDRLVARWMRTTRLQYEQDVKRVYYLSMEFLIGRTFSNALLALGIYDEVRDALAGLGVDLATLEDLEPDAALGNGGLGRLAACFLDSMATVGVPGFGYGIRYEYGMFRQTIVDGNQVEMPDYWLRAGNPWEFPRPEVVYTVHFGGRTVQHDDRTDWIDTEHVNAMAYDTVIPGFATTATNTLRLWSARATDEFDLSAFNQGDYRRAVEAKNTSEHVSRLLYPDDSTQAGRELRLRQEYFFVSATMQDLIRRYQRTHTHFGRLAEKVAVHLNDTHPVLAIPELMRLLVDRHHLPWDKAWKLMQQMFSYTNHTLMPEALETWDVEMLARLLPRHLEIIFEINAQFLEAGHREVRARCRTDPPHLARRRIRSAARAHGASGDRREPQGERRIEAALATDGAEHLLRFRAHVSGALHQRDERRHAATLARAGESVAVRADRQAARTALAHRSVRARPSARMARRSRVLQGVSRREVREQAASGGTRQTRRQRDHQSGSVVRPAGEAHPRVQAATAQHPVCDRALQPHPRESGAGLDAARRDVRGQGGVRVQDGEEHHQAHQRCREAGSTRTRSSATG